MRPLIEMKGTVKDEARNWIERLFESVLWNSRFLTLVAVVASLLGAIVMFFVAASDVLGLFSLARQYSNNALTVPEHLALRARIVASIAQSVDGFLFALVLIIFALGIYELFIGHFISHIEVRRLHCYSENRRKLNVFGRDRMFVHPRVALWS